MNHIITKKLTGFNLVELMIVLSILSLITAVAITNYISYSKKAAVTAASTLADNIKAKVMLYYTDQEQFPSLANGNATEINNSFNVSVLDANTKKYVSNTTFYSFSDASTPILPPSITSQLSVSATILGYIKIDLNPDQKLSKDPAVTAQIFLVASEISNSVSLNSLSEKVASISYDTPHIVLTASETQVGTQVIWDKFSVGIANQFIPLNSTPACSGNQILQGGTCALCAKGSYTSINTEGINICAPCELGKYSATEGSPSCTDCGGGTYTPAVGSSSCINCNTGIATCDATNGAAIACINPTPTASYSLTGTSGVAGTTCNVTCSGATYKLNNACQACTSTCSACTSTACSSCITGYYGTNCASSIASCTGIMSGSGVTAICNPCPTHANCSGGAIISCQTGYSGNNCANYCTGYLTGSGVSATCNNCPPNATCSNGAITGCQSGYSGSGGNCTSCTSAIITGCSSSTGGATSCLSGYQLSGTSGAAGTTCIVSCPLHSTGCSANGGATGCNSGFQLTGASGAAGTTCKVTCPSGSVWSDSPGAPAVDGSSSNAITYLDGPGGTVYTVCVCYSGLFPNYVPGVGTTCTCNVANCQTCVYNCNICQTCKTGYTPSSNGSQCILCNIARCGACSSTNICSYCVKPGYPYPITPVNNQCPP